MEWRDSCNRRATDCEDKADKATDPDVQALYLMLAQQWRELASVPEDRIHLPRPGPRRRR